MEKQALSVALLPNSHWFLFWSPFHIMIKALHLHKPVVQNDRGVVLVVISCYPEHNKKREEEKGDHTGETPQLLIQQTEF